MPGEPLYIFQWYALLQQVRDRRDTTVGCGPTRAGPIRGAKSIFEFNGQYFAYL